MTAEDRDADRRPSWKFVGHKRDSHEKRTSRGRVKRVLVYVTPKDSHEYPERTGVMVDFERSVRSENSKFELK